MKKQWHKYTKKNAHLKSWVCVNCRLPVKSEDVPEKCRNCRKEVFRPVTV